MPSTNFKFVPETKIDTKIAVDKKIVLLTDATSEDLNLNNMVKIFTACFNSNIDVINLHSVDIKGGCLGCEKCFKEGKCFYKDGYEKLFYEKINTADHRYYKEHGLYDFPQKKIKERFENLLLRKILW